MPKKSPRHLARSLAVQGVYYHKMNNASISDIETFLSRNCASVYIKSNYELMHFLLENAVNEYPDMLNLYTDYLNREISAITPVEQIILVIAAVELTKNLSVPSPVIINEAVELAKLYGATDSYKFINGLVDKLAAKLRAPLP